MSAQVTIPEDVLEVLRQSRVEGDRLYLPEGRLDNYPAVRKTLGLLRGQWRGGKVGAFVFDRDVSEVIPAITSAGTLVDEKKEFQFFETPEEVAARMVILARLSAGLTIFEPSAGRGALARVIRRSLLPGECEIYVGDSNPEMRRCLDGQGFKVCGSDDYDFLTYTPFFACDRIIQNPPFSRGQDAEHLMRAFDLLAPGGRLVSVMSGGITFRRDTVYREAASLVRECGGTVEELPAGSFKESGTNTRAVLVTLSK